MGFTLHYPTPSDHTDSTLPRRSSSTRISHRYYLRSLCTQKSHRFYLKLCNNVLCHCWLHFRSCGKFVRRQRSDAVSSRRSMSSSSSPRTMIHTAVRTDVEAFGPRWHKRIVRRYVQSIQYMPKYFSLYTNESVIGQHCAGDSDARWPLQQRDKSDALRRTQPVTGHHTGYNKMFTWPEVRSGHSLTTRTYI